MVLLSLINYPLIISIFIEDDKSDGSEIEPEQEKNTDDIESEKICIIDPTSQVCKIFELF